MDPGHSLAMDGDISSLFEAVVRERPEATALLTPRVRWTYAELNQRADCLASVLAAGGVSPDAVIAVAVEDPPSLAVCMLGILKAGATAVYLDVKSPPSRLREILADSSALGVVVEQWNRSPFAGTAMEDASIRVFELENAGPTPTSGPKTEASPGSLMAIYFTSGTTHRPRGICRSRAQALFEAQTFIREMGITPDDRLLMLVSFTFGASTRYALGALLSGATLSPVSPDVGGAAELVRFARDIRATHYYSTPSLFRHFCRAAMESPGEDTIRAITLTGEPVRTTDLDLFRGLVRGRSGILLNSLGSTECGAYCHLWVTPESTFPGDVLPAGSPVPGKEVLILDEQRLPVSEGETGEIAVRSAHLACGYWRRPDLDRELFTEPSGPSGERTFFTGDLGFRDPAGCIHLVGRKDHQVKIRGYRVELGEIESVLGRHPAVQTAVVLAEEFEEKKILVAYLELSGRSSAGRSELDRHVLGHLPQYMLPATYRIVDSVPLTERGKIDRRRIATGGFRSLEPTPSDVQTPDSALGEVQKIWSELLKVPEPRADSGFFELGGDSLLAMHFLTRVRARWGLVIPVAVFYQNPRLDAVSRWITAGAVFGPDSAVFPMNDHREGLPDLYFMPGWMRNTLELRPLARALAGRFNCFGLELPPGTEVSESIEDLAKYCVDIIALRKPSQPVYLGGFSLGGLIAYEAGRQLSMGRHPVAGVYILDSMVSAMESTPGTGRFLRFLRNLPIHPIRSAELVARRLWGGIGVPLLHRLGRHQADARPPSNFGPMPQRSAARRYRPQASDLRITVVYSWERRLQISSPRRPWSLLSPQPLKWFQLPEFHHDQLVKPHNIEELVNVMKA